LEGSHSSKILDDHKDSGLLALHNVAQTFSALVAAAPAFVPAALPWVGAVAESLDSWTTESS